MTQAASTEIESLLTALAEGDESAFERLYAKTSPYVFGLLLRILRSRPMAEETAQEVYLQIWRTADAFDPARGSGLAWIALIARSRAIDRARAEGSYGRALDDLEVRPVVQPVGEAVADPEELTSERERGRLVRSALEDLPPEQRETVERAFFRGETHREIAARTETPLGTVKSRIRAAIGKLEEALGPYLDEDAASGGTT